MAGIAGVQTRKAKDILHKSAAVSDIAPPIAGFVGGPGAAAGAKAAAEGLKAADKVINPNGAPKFELFSLLEALSEEELQTLLQSDLSVVALDHSVLTDADLKPTKVRVS